MTAELKGKVALVAGGTRGAGRGIAIELGAAGANVYVTGRSTRGQRSEYDRPETIEETAELVEAAGGRAIALRVDHLVPQEVEALVARIRGDQGRLDILVNDIWGGEHLTEWEKPVWEHSLENGLKMLRLAIDTHFITARYALPLLIERPGGLLVEMTDGTTEYNATHYRLNPYYDLVKTGVTRMAWAHGKDLEKHGCTAVSMTPGWMRSEMMLEIYGVTEETWRISSSPRRRASSAGRWRRWRGTRRWGGSTGSRSRAAGWRRSMGSTMWTGRGRIAGGIWTRWWRRGRRRMRWGIGEGSS